MCGADWCCGLTQESGEYYRRSRNTSSSGNSYSNNNRRCCYFNKNLMMPSQMEVWCVLKRKNHATRKIYENTCQTEHHSMEACLNSTQAPQIFSKPRISKEKLYLGNEEKKIASEMEVALCYELIVHCFHCLYRVYYSNCFTVVKH